MVIQEQSVNTSQVNNDIVAYLVEQFGEKVEELVDKTSNSYAKIKYKGEKDELAKLVEGIHYHPMHTAVKNLDNGTQYLSFLVHQKIVKELFVKSKERLKFVYGGLRAQSYILGLKNNNFSERDFFRKKLYELYESKPYSQFLDIQIEFMPEDANEKDILKEEVVKIDLQEA